MALAQISVNPGVLGGVPFVTGTHVAVSTVVAMVCRGHSVAEITNRYPELSESDVDACLEFQRCGAH